MIAEINVSPRGRVCLVHVLSLKVARQRRLSQRSQPPLPYSVFITIRHLYLLHYFMSHFSSVSLALRGYVERINTRVKNFVWGVSTWRFPEDFWNVSSVGNFAQRVRRQNMLEIPTHWKLCNRSIFWALLPCNNCWEFPKFSMTSKLLEVESLGNEP